MTAPLVADFLYLTRGTEMSGSLDLFAAAWVERWLALGGSITVSADGRSSLFAICNVSDLPWVRSAAIGVARACQAQSHSVRRLRALWTAERIAGPARCSPGRS